MRSRIVAMAGAALALPGLAACSSSHQTRPSNVAWVSVNGGQYQQHIARCVQLEWYQTIYIGDDNSGAKIVVDENAPPLTAQSVRINDLGGFTGMYSQGGGGDASTSFDENKDLFTINGTAKGFNIDKPNEPATAKFRITAAC